MKTILSASTLFLFFILSGCHSGSDSVNRSSIADPSMFSIQIPIGENSWLEGGNDREIISPEGIRNWTSLDSEITTYVRIAQPGTIDLGLQLRVPEGHSELRAVFAGKTIELELENTAYEIISLGSFEVPKPGYYPLVLTPTSTTASEIAQIDSLFVGGSAAEGIQFVEDNFHFGRRGPSVHLRYDIPEEKQTLYFYSEIEVPNGQDVVGSFYMANGFAHGYFGIQVNSPTERRVLFSVWSPYDTQDPNDIPEGYRIELLGKGDGVTTGEFGNEGSGGQSYKVFNWEPDTSYGFLLKGEPADESHTDYTAWFHDPADDKWHLIASFRRPHTHTYLANLYSFLENFVPATGDTERMAYYKNQWMLDTSGNWIEFTSATFTADATANAGHRLDYAGGTKGNAFYMKNCGFFDDYTQTGTKFSRDSEGSQPAIDLENLPR